MATFVSRTPSRSRLIAHVAAVAVAVAGCKEEPTAPYVPRELQAVVRVINRLPIDAGAQLRMAGGFTVDATSVIRPGQFTDLIVRFNEPGDNFSWTATVWTGTSFIQTYYSQWVNKTYCCSEGMQVGVFNEGFWIKDKRWVDSNVNCVVQWNPNAGIGVGLPSVAWVQVASP